MRRTSIRFPLEAVNEIRTAAALQGVTFSALVRAASTTVARNILDAHTTAMDFSNRSVSQMTRGDESAEAGHGT